ncbi:MAG TPA: hypothetical protein VFT99_10700, partial [Roseiflexaceae bacterium]|nr:hypothetical protein [Roseiflexaceae bacterium]
QPYAQRVVGVLIRYLQWNRLPALSRLQTVRIAGQSDILAMDATSRRTLEILSGPDGSSYGSLLAVLDSTRTPMGGRLLKTWLTQGLRSPTRLEARYDAVQASLENSLAREELRRSLGQIGDLERVINRLLLSPERATPRDLARLRDALRAAEALGAAQAELGGLDVAVYNPLPELRGLLERALAPTPRASLIPRADAEMGDLLAAGWDAELDALLSQETSIKGEIERLIETLSLITGIRSLQYKRDARTQQIVMTLSSAEARKTPADWSRIAKGKEQYTNQQLIQLSDTLNDIEGQRADVERSAWGRLWLQVAAHGPQLLQLARDLAQIDVLTALAHVAVRERWTRPAIVA